MLKPTTPKLLVFCTASFILASPLPAWAVQTHGGAEGLISHQISHILFLAGMILLLYWLQKDKLRGRDWLFFRYSVIFIIAWNILTFTGHWLHEYVPAGKFITFGGKIVGFQATTFFDYIFYLSRLDHLILVPAILLFFLAIRQWAKTSAP